MQPISNRQRRTIFALAGELGMDEDCLHDLAFDVTGQQSIRSLSDVQADALIRELRKRSKPQPQNAEPAQPKKKAVTAPAEATEAQQRKVWALMYALDAASPSSIPLGNRLCGIIKKELHQDAFPADPFVWLNYRKCSKLIDILKQYVNHTAKKGVSANG